MKLNAVYQKVPEGYIGFVNIFFPLSSLRPCVFAFHS